MYKLLSATPSPYARKVRIALAEKEIPFELITEVPWDQSTATANYNPLEKLPILIPENGEEPVYESRLILEYLEIAHPDPPLSPANQDDYLAAKKLEALCDGICDALVLMFVENMRPAAMQSGAWTARQRRKVDGGLKALSAHIGGNEFAVGDTFTLGDIASATVLGYLSLRWPDIPWRAEHPNLRRYSEGMEKRPSLERTRPSVQTISDTVV